MSETTLDDVVRFILRENCPDCFHPECMEAVDLADAVIEWEKGNR